MSNAVFQKSIPISAETSQHTMSEDTQLRIALMAAGLNQTPLPPEQ